MLIMNFGWQGIVSSVWVISWNDRVDGWRVLTNFSHGELILGVHKGGGVGFCDLLFFHFCIFLDTVNAGISSIVAFLCYSRGTSRR